MYAGSSSNTCLVSLRLSYCDLCSVRILAKVPLKGICPTISSIVTVVKSKGDPHAIFMTKRVSFYRQNAWACPYNNLKREKGNYRTL